MEIPFFRVSLVDNQGAALVLMRERRDTL